VNYNSNDFSTTATPSKEDETYHSNFRQHRVSSVSRSNISTFLPNISTTFARAQVTSATPKESVLNLTVTVLICAIDREGERMEELMVQLAEPQRSLDGVILKLCKNIVSHHRLNFVIRGRWICRRLHGSGW
jgi:hypothetical protein